MRTTQLMIALLLNYASMALAFDSSPFSIQSYGNQGVFEYEVYTSPPATISGNPVGAITYSISGDDASLFSIDTSSGVVSMDPKLHNNPLDADANNLYSVLVTGTDTALNTSDQYLDLVVFNLCGDDSDRDRFELSAPDSIADLNGDSATLRISLVRTGNNPEAGTAVIFVSGSGGSNTTITSPSGTTDASGVYETTVNGNSLGVSQFTAMYDSDNDGVPDEMIPMGSPTNIQVVSDEGSFAINGRVGIGTESPDPSTVLEVAGNDKGVLIPRIALTGISDSTTIATPAATLLVYNTSSTGGLSPGFFFWNGSSWQEVCEF